MSRAKDMLEEDISFEEYLNSIVENIDDTKVQGIIKKAIDIGFNNLSEKQQYTVKNGITDYIMNECPNCEEKIEYENMELAIFNGKCSTCQNDWDKNYID